MDVLERHAILAASLEQSRERMAALAAHETAQRDTYTSKIRFGSVALNAASLVTALNVVPLLPGLTVNDALIAATFFFIGTILGGLSLTSHQNQLIRTAGRINTIAINLERAVSLTKFPPGSPEHEKLGEVIDLVQNITEQGIYEPGIRALTAQHFSMWAWVGGVVSVAAVRLPALAQWWPF